MLTSAIDEGHIHLFAVFVVAAHLALCQYIGTLTAQSECTETRCMACALPLSSHVGCQGTCFALLWQLPVKEFHRLLLLTFGNLCLNLVAVFL